MASSMPVESQASVLDFRSQGSGPSSWYSVQADTNFFELSKVAGLLTETVHEEGSANQNKHELIQVYPYKHGAE